jgi:hypothetical protein
MARPLTDRFGATPNWISPGEAVIESFLESPSPGDTLESIHTLDTPTRRTKVRIVTNITGITSGRMNSAEYLAAIRRRKCKEIARDIEDLSNHVEEADFCTWTHRPLAAIRNLLAQLSSAEEFSDPEHEGNSCEILRQVRDTFLRGGWERYREHSVRGAALRFLSLMASADEIMPALADQSIDAFMDLGLDPFAQPRPSDGETPKIPH